MKKLFDLKIFKYTTKFYSWLIKIVRIEDVCVCCECNAIRKQINNGVKNEKTIHQRHT